jgi:glycosyltransferase involved in cell wall biosynthesis
MDTKDMERGLRELVVDEDRRLALGRVAVSRAIDYDWSKIAAKYLDVYERVMSRAPVRDRDGNAVSA